MSLLTIEDVTAVMEPGIEVEDLQDVIDRQESFLASRIGPLVGEMTQTLVPTRNLAHPLVLKRPTDETDLSDVEVNGYVITRTDGEDWSPPVVVTYTPTDEAQVKEVLIELVRLALTSSTFNQEATEGHSYSRSKDVTRLREQLVRTLMPKVGPTTVPVLVE